MNESFYWYCGHEIICQGNSEACIACDSTPFESVGDAARAALNAHPQHLHHVYVVGSKTGYKGTAFGLNFNGIR